MARNIPLKCCAVTWENGSLFRGFYQCEIKLNSEKKNKKVKKKKRKRKKRRRRKKRMIVKINLGLSLVLLWAVWGQFIFR